MPWVKGESGNPGGRRRDSLEVREVRKLATEKTVRAFHVIDDIMEDATEKGAVRLAAALAVLKLAGVNMSGEVTLNVTPQQPAPAVETPELEADLGPTGAVQ